MITRYILIFVLFGWVQTAVAIEPLATLAPFNRAKAPLLDADHWLAIVGDSGVTGAASQENLEPTWNSIMSHLTGFLTAPPPPPTDPNQAITRVFYSAQEFHAAFWALDRWLLNVGARLALRLDTHQHSFGYQVGRALKIADRDIVLVGQDGVQVNTIADQFSRIYEIPTKTLPPLVLLSYTANDLCDIKVFATTPEEWGTQFQMALTETWSAAEPYLKAHPHGTRIVVLAPLDVVNVITNPEIMVQKVTVEGQGAISCGQLRHGDLHAPGVSAWLVLRMLNLMCPSVTATHPGDDKQLQQLRNVQQLFNSAWKDEIELLNKRFQGQGITWSYLESVRDLHFATGDVSNDCFHPSVRGHQKLADLVLRSLSAK